MNKICIATQRRYVTFIVHYDIHKQKQFISQSDTRIKEKAEISHIYSAKISAVYLLRDNVSQTVYQMVSVGSATGRKLNGGSIFEKQSQPDSAWIPEYESPCESQNLPVPDYLPTCLTNRLHTPSCPPCPPPHKIRLGRHLLQELLVIQRRPFFLENPHWRQKYRIRRPIQNCQYPPVSIEHRYLWQEAFPDKMGL